MRRADLLLKISPFNDDRGLPGAAAPYPAYTHYEASTALSAFAHLAVILVLVLGARSTPAPSTRTPEVVWVPLSEISASPENEHKPTKPPAEPIPQPERQIVSPPAAEPAPPKKETRLLSERESRTEREQIRRGLEAESAPPMPTEAMNNSATKSRTRTGTTPSPGAVQTGAAPKLRLSEDALLAALDGIETDSGATRTDRPAGSDDFEQPGTTDVVRERRFEGAKPFSRNAFRFGLTGSSDFLPGIPDGDITMLNAKADRFAVFVRRVALQVFSALRRHNWHSLSAAEISRMNGFATVEATMSPSGKLLNVTVTGSSGSVSFDRVLVNSAQDGTWDQNPPAEAKAADGRIRFLFKARTWSRPTERGEQRWLLLGTGLL